MTTIAYDGKLLCTDSFCSSSYINQAPIQKLFYLPDHKEYVAAAFAGSINDMDAMLGWVLDNDEKPNFNDDSQLMVIDLEGRCWDWWAKCYGRALEGIPGAGGSGGDFAMGAMLSGKSAFQAVEIACKLDPKSGGPIQCYDIQTRTLTGPFSG